MSEAVLFEIGSVIFVVVSTAVFLYGWAWFRDFEDEDMAPAQVSAETSTRPTRSDPA